jgi:hypothetical protein
MRAGAYLFLAAVAISSCTQVLGIDGRYVREGTAGASGGITFGGSGGAFDAAVETGGERSNGGTGGSTGGSTGGRIGGGGVIASGGTIGNGGVVTGGAPPETGGLENSGGMTAMDANAPCGQGEKRCDTVGCVVPDPSVGCDLTTPCAPCDTSQFPEFSHPICANSKCDYECYTGYTRNQATGTCDAPTSGTGGAGGSGGAGSIGAKCTPMPNPLSPSPDCKYCGVFPGCCNPLTQNRCGCLYVAACI